jgi:membrane-bound serine protease (ClpP class)
MILFIGELGFWHRRMRKQPKVVGSQRLIGASGVALSACRPEGQARVDGTIWTARCERGVDAGESVRVIEVDGLTLVVEPWS